MKYYKHIAYAALTTAVVTIAVPYTQAETKVDSIQAVSAELPPIYIEKTIKLPKNGSLVNSLVKVGFSHKEVYEALNPLNRNRSMRRELSRMRPGDKIHLTYIEDKKRSPDEISRIVFHTRSDRTLTVTNNDGTYKANKKKRELVKEDDVAVGKINSSLYASARKAGLPAGLVVPFANLFAWELDFTRDIRPGAEFKVVYEKVLDENGDYLRNGNILAAELTTKGKTYQAFRYKYNGIASYYDAKGRSKRKSLLRTPLEFTRISSHFNLKRKHPILGYTRAHKGTDFAAPRGTPIKAAGDGVVEKASWYGGYGRYVRIRHSNGFKSAYAHMKRYGRGIKSGKTVKQGQIIGYVGTSGRSTGPHLHYEVLKNGRHVNAMRIKMAQSKTLPKKYRKSFKQKVASLTSRWSQEVQVAQKN